MLLQVGDVECGVGVLTSFAGVPASWSARSFVVASVVACAMVGYDSTWAAAAMPRERVPAAPAEESAGELTAPDGFSARVLAAQREVRVEDLSSRTAVSSTFALPDGTWQTVTASGPVWVRTGGDGTAEEDWAAADATLSRTPAGDFVPVAHVGAVRVAGEREADASGSSVVASVTDPVSGVTSELTWPGDLPEPAVSGPRAVYAGVADGMDMVVDVTATGVEQYFVLHERPDADEQVQVPLGLSASEGASLEQVETGHVEVLAEDGSAAAALHPAIMWDATADEVRAAPVTQEWDEESQPALWAVDDDPAGAQRSGADEAKDQGQVADVSSTVQVEGSEAQVVLEPAADFLSSPATVFPVVVDPSVTIGVNFDTMVQSNSTSDLSSSTDLLMGSWDGGATKARSFIGFATTPIKGKKILSATLNLWMYHSYSCQAREWQVWSTAAVSTATRWSAQPTWHTNYATTSDTKGYSSACADGWSNVAMTSWAQAAANSASTINTIGLRATSETDSYAWKRFNSGNATSGKPTLSVTYTSYPGRPAGRSITPCGSCSTSPKRTSSTTPKLTGGTSDPDGGTLRYDFEVWAGTAASPTTMVTSGSVSGVASGKVAAWTVPSGKLTNGSSYEYRVRAFDGHVYGPWSDGWATFTVDTTKPWTPTVTATGYTAGQWRTAKPASNTFTFASAADTTTFEYAKDGASTWTSVPATSGSGTLSWNPTSGAHTLRVRAIDEAGNVSPARTFSFGLGSAALTAPVQGMTSTDTFTVKASGPTAGSGTVTPKVYWRTAGTANGSGYDAAKGSTAGWTLVEELDPIAAGDAVQVSPKVSGSAIAAELGKERVPLSLQLQVCFTYSADSTTWCTWNDASAASQPTVVRVPHAFGDAYPTADAGPGQVALWTGELNTTATDVTVPGYIGDLSISRTYSTLAESSEAGAGFGPGWAASFDGVDVGVAGYEVVNSTTVDGTIALVDGEGEAWVFAQPGGTKTALKTGVYTAVDTDTQTSGTHLQVTGSGTSTRVVFTDADGSVTTFAPVDAARSDWVPESVSEPTSSAKTTFTRDSAGRVTQILAPAASGVTCEPLAAGCRALQIRYATATTATASSPGSFTGQVASVDYVAWDPATSAMGTVRVAEYAYDTAGRLVTVTDPRIDLGTTYTWSGTSASGQPLLRTLTPSGLKGYTFTYGPAGAKVATTSLLHVTRANPTGSGSSVLARFVYDVPVTGNTALPDMGAEATGVWGQEQGPAYGAAVFAADRQQVAGSTPAQVGAADWPFADLQYTDAQGRVTNTAAYGAGAWRPTATTYDDGGRVVRELDTRAIAQITDLYAQVGDLSDEVIGSYATITRYNTDLASTADATGPTDQPVTAGTVILPAGSVVTDTWAPATTGPDGVDVRVHTHTDYDTGAPNNGVNPKTGQAWALATAVTQSTADPLSGSWNPAVPVAGDEPVLTRTLTGYAPQDGSTDPLGSTSGWVLGSGTTSTVVTDYAANTGLTTTTVYDSDGRTLRSWGPKSTGADEGTTFTSYYTAAAQTGADAICGNSPQWAGLTCRTWHGGATLPVTVTTGYSRYMAPATVVETSGTATRTSTTTYDAAGRIRTTAISATGLTGSTPVPDATTEYDPVTGLATAIVAMSNGTETGRITTGYDTWGRTTTYTDTDGAVTTTTYDTAGRTATTTDPTGTTTYTYDYAGTPAEGTERRGLLTAQTVTGVGDFTATYDGDGNLTTQTMPGQVTQALDYDRTGQETTRTYTRDDTVLASWTTTSDALGRTTSTTGPSAAGGTRTQQYQYDNAARLVRVDDTIDDACTTRAYAFDANGNRTSLSRTTRDADCTTTGTEDTSTWTHDAADRVQTGANSSGTYVYDPFGRQTTIPAADTPAGPGAGDLTISYHDDDLPRSLTQAGTTTTWTLDPAARRSVETSTGATTGTLTRHYADTSDNPAWATTGGTTTRYTSSIGGDLGASTTTADETTTTVLDIVDPHGNIATTLTTDGTVNALSVYDEYGTTLTANPDAGALTYGWLGAKERATTSTGLLLMGVRLYNPVTGLFTSVDPVPGGNTTAYTYPQDPLNKYDLDGKSWWSRTKTHISRVGRRVGKHFRSNWRTYAKVAVSVAVVGGVAACAIATAGICGSLVGMYAATAAMGAAGGAAGYGLGRGRKTVRGYARAAGIGAITSVGGAYAGRVMFRAFASMQFRGTAIGISRRLFSNRKYWRP